MQNNIKAKGADGIMIETGLSIRGHPVPLAKNFDRAEPVTGIVVTRAAAATVERANAAGDAALPAWSALGPNSRRAQRD